MNNPESQADALLVIYRKAFEHSMQGFCLLEKAPPSNLEPLNFYCLLTNSAFEQQLGVRLLADEPIHQLLPQTQPPILEYYNQVALTGQPAHFDALLSGLNRWITVDAFRIGNFERPWIGVLFTDITERKRREANLTFLAEVSRDLVGLTDIDQTMNALGEKIAAYLDLSASAFAELKENAQIGVINYGWHRHDMPSMLGTYRMDEFVTSEVLQLCQAGQAVIIRDVFDDPRTDGQQYAAFNVGSFVVMPLVRDGEWRFLLVVYRSQPHDWRHDEVELLRELTTRIWTRLERARAEEALRLEDRRKDEFMAMLGHELRNPLAVLSNTLVYLEMTQGQDERLTYAMGVQRMSGQVTHLGRMVDDLLDVSRIRQGKIRLKRQPVELGPLVEQTVGAAQSLFQERNQSVDLMLTSLPVVINGDATRLSQILMNLLTNATKYTPEGGHIWVRLDQQAGQAVLSVKDDGMGIPADELTAIFEVFVQGNTSLDRPHGGLGLGLAVVKQIVQRHQGQIEAFSVGAHQGSEFIIKLPLLMEKQRTQPPATEASSIPRDAVRVLLVDDNKELIDLMGMILQKQGYDVHLRYSGQEGIVAAEALQPDIMLMDIGMPYLDGYAVCQRIRQQAWGERLPILALTGFGQEADKQRSWASGFDGHLLKPVDYASLPDILTKTIAAKKSALDKREP